MPAGDAEFPVFPADIFMKNRQENIAISCCV
jgi:hypothetical protein